MSYQFENAYCKVNVQQGDYEYEIIVDGKIAMPIANDTIHYIAASPPDFRASYSGSGLPYVSQIQAFENTPNKGIALVKDGKFEIRLMMPNSYYVGLGTVYVPPKVFLEFVTLDGEKKNMSIVLSEGIPYRSLTVPGAGQKTRARANTLFYDTQFRLPVRSQEQILRESTYPHINKMEEDFWGRKPPL